MSRRFIGHLDAIEPALTGWVIDRRHPDQPVRVIAIVDGTHRVAAIADRARPDVAAAGHGGSRCGFALALPRQLFDGRAHDIELTADDGQQLGLAGWHSPVVLGPLRGAAIAALGAADIAAVAVLLRATYTESGLDPDIVDNRTAAGWIGGFLGRPGGLLLGARVERRLVGYAALEAAPDPAAALGAVAISILQAYRRKGLGERLLRALLARASDRAEIREVWLSVAPENLPARRLYEKLGFVRRADPPPSLSVPANYLAMRWRGNRPLP